MFFILVNTFFTIKIFRFQGICVQNYVWRHKTEKNWKVDLNPEKGTKVPVRNTRKKENP